MFNQVTIDNMTIHELVHYGIIPENVVNKLIELYSVEPASTRELNQASDTIWDLTKQVDSLEYDIVKLNKEKSVMQATIETLEDEINTLKT